MWITSPPCLSRSPTTHPFGYYCLLVAVYTAVCLVYTHTLGFLRIFTYVVSWSRRQFLHYMNDIVCKGQLDWINVYNSITSSFAAAIVSNGFKSSADNVPAADFSILHIPIFLKKSYITTILEWINFHICHLQKSLQKDHHFSTVHKLRKILVKFYILLHYQMW